MVLCEYSLKGAGETPEALKENRREQEPALVQQMEAETEELCWPLPGAVAGPH